MALATSIVVAGLTTSNMVLAQTCSGVLITSDCQDLSYSGPGGPTSNITISSPATVTASRFGYSVSFGDGTNNPNLNAFTNNGTISGVLGLVVNNAATVGTLTNNGLIIPYYNSVQNNGTIGAFINSGTISPGGYNDGVLNNSVITTLTNTGTINSSGGYSGINNGGTITTLNNGQGGIIHWYIQVRSPPITTLSLTAPRIMAS
ncbi:hypothetical protein [Polynucleobacter sphagniphilus]|uniref:hypothetical protein n=1 Tax=Polynucleobacter sphagniphilus TaxID=1743169 RepID=UPI0024743324|nr:hypothetical protein [Polynucleobacter sphagniphilus]